MKNRGDIAAIVLWISIMFACPGAILANDISTRLILAFQNGNASILQPHIPADHRIQMGISGLQITEGNYSSTQAVALLQQAFKHHKTVAFSLETRGNAIKCEWRIRNNQSNVEKLVVLYVSFQSRDGEQIITSIRGS